VSILVLVQRFALSWRSVAAMQVGWVALEIGLLIVGAVFVLAAVLPGTSKLFGNEMLNRTRKLRRVGVGCIGLVLIVAALLIRGAIINAPTNTEPPIAAQPATAGDAKGSGASGETLHQAAPKEAPGLVQLATVALYSCHAPSDPPAPPDGASASKDQMITSKRETSKYNDDMNQYLDCLKTTSANLEAQYRGTAAAGEISEVDALAVRLNNDAVDRLQLKVKAFNGELAKYKARSAP
jgi:hypothetical protein